MLRRSLLAGLILSTLSASASAKLPVPVPMEGPFTTAFGDVCARETKGTSSTCHRVAQAKVGGLPVEIHVVTDGESFSIYYAAVQTQAGWFVSRTSMPVELAWHEHGPDYLETPDQPVVSELALPSGRPAFTVALRIRVTYQDCRTQGNDHCSSGSEVDGAGLLACGRDAGGGWACLPGMVRDIGAMPPARFSKQGRLEHAVATGALYGANDKMVDNEQEDGDQLEF